MGRRHEQKFSQIRNTDGQMPQKKMPHLINHQGNANQKTVKYHLTLETGTH